MESLLEREILVLRPGRDGERRRRDGAPGRLSRKGAFQVDVGQFEVVLVWAASGHGEIDPADSDADERADLSSLSRMVPTVALANWV